jgi:hypothetical protein
MVSHFQQGLLDLEPLWRQILSPRTFEQLTDLNPENRTSCRLPDELWSQIVFDAAVAYHHQVLPREHLLKSLTPLYLGRTASFVLTTQGLTSAEAEHTIEHLCLTFERSKPYLLARWEGREVQRASWKSESRTTREAGGHHEQLY